MDGYSLIISYVALLTANKSKAGTGIQYEGMGIQYEGTIPQDASVPCVV